MTDSFPGNVVLKAAPQYFCQRSGLLITLGAGEPVLVTTLYSGKSFEALKVPLRVLFDKPLGQFSTRSSTQKMVTIFNLVMEY